LILLRRRHLLAAGAAWAGPLRAAGVAPLIAAVKPSICAVGTFKATDSPRFTLRGTGFLVGDGSLVATCAHVLPEVMAESAVLAVQIVDAAGTPALIQGEAVATERAHDLSLIRLKRRAGNALPLADAALPAEGTEIALIGFPLGGALGFRPITHRGIVAAVVASSLPAAGARQLGDTTVRRLREGSFELLQLDATAYPGNSGGPLFDIETGQVIGVVNMGMVIKGQREYALSHPSGISYAVPVRHVRELLATL
jgi:S1-C subfamily serine protease